MQAPAICSSAGVHSAAWILTISAALTSRAFWNSHSPSALGILAAQPVDDGVVLAREQRVHDRQADPPIAVDRGVFLARGGVGVAVERQMSVRVEPELAVGSRSSGPSVRRLPSSAVPRRIAASAVLGRRSEP